ncbi:MAG: flippase-like domain-containing protein [Ignavibacteriae bacterium]|nr:flippase-like domain-containing protein [Ignavibacteriota bacterium]
MQANTLKPSVASNPSAKFNSKQRKIDKKNLIDFLKSLFKKKFLMVLFSAGLLYLLLMDVKFSEIIHSIKTADLFLLVIAFSLHALGLTISAYRWRLLLKSLKVPSKIPYLIKSYLVATFFNHFIPSTVGGDSVRAYDSYKLGNNKSKGLAVIMVDRFLGLLALLIFVIISTFLSIEVSSKIPSLSLLIVLASVGAALFIYFIFNPPIKFFTIIEKSSIKIVSKFGSILVKIGGAFTQFGNRRKTLSKALALSFLLQANVILYYYLISKALGFDVHIFNFSLIIPLTIFITMFPFSVNGIGIRENALFFFFSFFGIAKSQAIAFAWIEFGMLLTLGVIGGFVYMFRKIEAEKVKEAIS